MKVIKIATLFLIILFTSSMVHGQTSEIYVDRSSSNICNQTIVLFPDGIYNLKSDCDAASHFSFGNWIQKKDTILFDVANNKTFTVIKSVVSSKVDNKNLTVKIFDINGQNITGRISIGQYITNKGSYMLNPDSSKTAKVDYKREGGILILRSLQKLFSQKIEIETGDSNCFEITLNISKDWIFTSSADWGGHRNFKLLKSKEGLRSLSPADKIIYKLQ